MSGKKIVPMSELKRMSAGLRLTDVVTYLNSGNVIFRSAKKPSDIERSLEIEIAKVFAFEVKVIVFSISQIGSILAGCPFDEGKLGKEEKIYITLLAKIPDRDSVSRMNGFTDQSDEWAISGRAVYLLVKKGYAKTLFNNSFIERTLSVVATTRNANTLRKISEIGTFKR